jgi:esterase/lipase
LFVPAAGGVTICSPTRTDLSIPEGELSKNGFLFAVIAVALLLATGCSHYQYEGAIPTISAETSKNAEPRGEIDFFKYESRIHEIPMQFKFVKETKDWICYRLKFEGKDFVEGKNKYAKAFLFVQKDQTRKAPCLLVLPPTGGPADLAGTFGEYYADRGFTVMGFMRRERFFRPDKPLEYNKHLFRQAVIDVRRGIDFFETREDADSSRVAVMGISLGGIITGLTLASDDRVDAAAMIVSAGHLPQILDTSGYKVVKKLRKGMMDEGVKREELSAYVEDKISEIDPINYADRIDPGKLIMVNGNMDNIIKKKVAKATWEDLGKPEMRLIPAGHYTTMIFKGYAQRKIYAHFLNLMELEEDENGKVRPTTN